MKRRPRSETTDPPLNTHGARLATAYGNTVTVMAERGCSDWTAQE